MNTAYIQAQPFPCQHRLKQKYRDRGVVGQIDLHGLSRSSPNMDVRFII